MKDIRLAKWLAPLCLCSVAVVHWARVNYCQQTPWKGGGFGMFSTVDSNAARFLGLYAVCDGQRIAIDVPASLKPVADKLKTAPNQQRLDTLANKLAQLDWQEIPDHSAAIRHYLAQTDQQRLDSVVFVGLKQQPSVGSANSANGKDGSRFDDFAGSQLRLEPGGGMNSTAIQAIVVELWRYRFNRRQTRVVAEEMLRSRVETSPAST